MGRSPLVLVADDEENVLRLLRVTFTTEGYDVVAVDSGLAAMRAFELGQPDLAILDVIMPGVDGFGVLEYIRERSDIPVIMISAREEPDWLERALDAGADDYVMKPFNGAELLARGRAKMKRSGRVGTRRHLEN